MRDKRPSLSQTKLSKIVSGRVHFLTLWGQFKKLTSGQGQVVTQVGNVAYVKIDVNMNESMPKYIL